MGVSPYGKHETACQAIQVRKVQTGSFPNSIKQNQILMENHQITQTRQYFHKIPIALWLLAVPALQQGASAAVLAVNLGTAADFAIVAGAGITASGAIHSTTITGDLGSFPTPSITGSENIFLTGVNHGGDAVAQQAKIDLGLAYSDAAGRIPSVIFSPIYDLGGLVLGAGVYNDPSSLSITGNLTLDAAGDPDAVWIFQAGSTLTTGSGSSVSLIGGAKASNVFWQVGSSATLGTGSQFAGSILAYESISMNTGAEIVGRALAQNGAVTLDDNTIVIPELGSSMLLGFSMILSLVRRRRVAKPEFCKRP